MRCPVPGILVSVLCLALPATARAEDDFTLYELLAPETHAFAITYDTTTSRAGAEFYLNAVRAGAEVSDERVIDRATGRELQWELVTGAEAKRVGLLAERAPDDGLWLQIRLAEAVSAGAEARVRIHKTYRDSDSYFRDGDTVVFARRLGIRANAVVLPAGYELVGSATPGIVSTLADGRIKISFLNDRDDALEVRVVGRRLAAAEGAGARR